MITSQSFSKEQAIKEYAAAGIGLFPCRSNKKPAMEQSWKLTKPDASLRPSDLPDFFGAALPPNIVVYDVDVKRFVPGERDQFLQLLEKFAIPKPLDTLIVETPSGGRHIYMKCPPGRNYQMFLNGFPAIEVKSLGRYVIAAGSKGYKVIKGSLDNLMEAPEALLAYCEQTARSTGDDVIDDSKPNQDRFIRYCEHEALPAIENSGGDSRTFKTALVGRDYGLSEGVAYEIMLAKYNPRCVPKWGDGELRKKVANAYAYNQNNQGKDKLAITWDDLPDEVCQLFKSKDGSNARLEIQRWDRVWRAGTVTEILSDSLINHVNYFLTDFGKNEKTPNPLLNLIGFNEVSQKIEFLKPAPWHRGKAVKAWSDSDDVHLYHYMLLELGYFNCKRERLAEAIVIVAAANRFDPIVDWLDSIKWDGKKRLDTWLIRYCHTEDNPYTRFVSKAMIMAPVARAYNPGVQYDEMVVLEGAQGTYKSTLIRILGGEFYADIPLHVSSESDTKRTLVKTVGKWIIECSEMAFTSKQKAEDVKSFMSITADTILLPYGRRAVDIARRWAIYGTHNPHGGEGYLSDPTGNRRFYPVLTEGKIDVDGVREIREQLFAEAKYRVQNGEAFHIQDANVMALAKCEQAKREIVDVWIEIVSDWEDDETKTTLEGKSTAWIAEWVLNIHADRYDRRHSNRISSVMRKLGYELVQQRKDRVYVWKKKLNA